MKGARYFVTAIVALIVLVAVAPIFIALSHALIPLLIVGAVAIIAVRLIFIHTRGF